MAEVLTDRSIDITARVSCAKPADAILAAAELIDADLIVLGAHGMPRMRDALFGTTGTHVVRHSERPVLIVQNDAAEPYSKVLVATENVESARPILDATLDVARGSEVFAVHAFYPSLRQSLGGNAEIDQEEKLREEEIEELLARVAVGRLAGKLTANRHAIVETGEALSVIMRETEELKPDLLAMGTRRRATYLGSRAVDTLFWCPHDVLVVPERQSKTVLSAVNA